MTAATETPASHPTPPFGVVDADGVVWPWDGREPNEGILAAGSRYIYTCEDYYRAVERSEALSAAQAKLPQMNPLLVPPKPEDIGDMKQVQRAMGFKPDAGESVDAPDYVPNLD